MMAAICTVCEAKTGHLPKCVAQDLQTILDCMSGADGGVSYVVLRSFLGECAKQDNDAIMVRKLAALIRHLNPHMNEG